MACEQNEQPLNTAINLKVDAYTSTKLVVLECYVAVVLAMLTMKQDVAFLHLFGLMSIVGLFNTVQCVMQELFKCAGYLKLMELFNSG